MKYSVEYSEGYVKNDELVNYVLGSSDLRYIIGNASCCAPNSIERREEMLDEYINEYYFPFLGNCEYGSELSKMIRKYVIDEADYDVKLNLRLNFRVKAPYVESTIPYICIEVNSEQRILHAMQVLRDKGVEEKYILDLLNAE